MAIARDGWPFILTPLLASALLFGLRLPGLGAATAVLGLFTAFFFRDPERQAPQDPRLVLSPADGKVVFLAEAPPGHALGAGAWQLSIFLSIFDVHVNRAPVGGRIVGVDYHKGEFLPAFNDKASLRNEQNEVTIQEGQTRVIFKQIAGLIARRIVFEKRVDDLVAPGERVGLIRFGSRVDVFLPREFKARVRVGERVRGGTSILAERSAP
jgi:phosphatidylserine decarboxylase